MQVPVLVEKVAGNGYRAREVWPWGGNGSSVAEGATREEALDKLRALIQERLPGNSELVQLELGAAAEVELLRNEVAALQQRLHEIAGDPWRRMQGIYKDDPLFEEWQQAIADYRREKDDDPDVL